MALVLLKAGKSTRVVAREFGCGVRSVERLRKKVREVGVNMGVKDNPKSGRKRVVMERDITLLVSLVKEHPFMSAAQMKEKVKPRLDHLDVRRIQDALLKAGYPSRKAWGAISGRHGRGGLKFLPKNQTMNGEWYTAILEDHLLPWYQGRHCNWFMQDGAPCHTSKHSMGWLRDKGVRVLPWPGNSPDLNPIENAWNLIKNRLENCKFKNLAELEACIKMVWCREVTPRYMAKLERSMPPEMPP